MIWIQPEFMPGSTSSSSLKVSSPLAASQSRSVTGSNAMP